MHNHKHIFFAVATLALALILALSGYPSTAFAADQDSDNDGIPDVAEQILGTNPKNADTDGDGVNDVDDQNPVFAENPIVNNATQVGFTIVEGLVENNVDPVTRKDASDHLEITLKNTTGKDLSGFEVYYTITDNDTQKQEGYDVKVPDFVLKAGETVVIHFDTTDGPNHVLENVNSMYRTNPNAKTFDVVVSVPGFKTETVHIHKDAGGAEEAD